MTNRWNVLALLFCVRVAMALQFQAVAALSPWMMEAYGFGLADIGLMIGLYLSPGIVFALPGAAVGKRFGDKQTVAFGMALMLVGGLVTVLTQTWEAQVAGRVLAGAGGVILNVLMSKMVTDWFPRARLATAMGIFVNSWPVGIALGLLALPMAANAFGLSVALWLVVGLVAIGLAALLTLYRPPAEATKAANVAPTPLGGAALTCLLIASAIWTLYNAALGMIFSFGPALLAERGWSAAHASSTTSIALWLVALSVPLGGALTDRLQRRDAVLTVGLVAFAALMLLTPRASHDHEVIAAFIALGAVAGLPAGPIMSLSSEVLQPGERAFGMGLFFTAYYAGSAAAPAIAGYLAAAGGGADATFIFGAALLIACVALLRLFRSQADRVAGRIAAE